VGRHLQAEYGQEPQCILTMPLLEGLDGVEKMSKSKNNYIGISEDANTMFAKVLSISDTLMWRWYTLLSFRSLAEIEALKAEVQAGRNPKDAKVALAREITARFHVAGRGRCGRAGFHPPQPGRRARGHPGAGPAARRRWCARRYPALLRQAGLVASSGEGNRLIDGHGVRIDAVTISDKGLKLGAGTYVLQVGKRSSVRVTLG